MKITRKIISAIVALSIVFGTFAYMSVSSSAVENELGDTNSDGSVNSFDALMIVRYITSVESLNAAEIAAADVDGDGKVTTTDALYILKFAVGEIGTFPASGETKRTKIYGSYWYDPATGNVSNDEGSGLLGFSYDADENVFYASLNAWQRHFGYTYLYDMAAPFGYIWYDTSRIYFTYEDKEYMMQLWKGRYGMPLVGCEIGLYYRDVGDTKLIDNNGNKYFKCADNEMLVKMSLSLFKDGNLLFSRHEQYSWWLTGFVLRAMTPTWGMDPTETAELKVVSNIKFKDAGMMNAFIEGLEKTTEIEHNATKKTRTIKFQKNKEYFVNVANNSVTINWE